MPIKLELSQSALLIKWQIQLQQKNLQLRKKKKRRSGSLTRMFNGLKKIVGTKSDEISPTVVTPDLLLTPSISRSVKKRKMESGGLSNKKKKDVISKLPEGKILKMPFVPVSTPISENPKGKEKKSQWYSRNKISKQPKPENEENIRASRLSLGTRSILERRWSAVSSSSAFKRNKKIKPYGGSQHNLTTNSSEKESELPEGTQVEESLEDGFVKISKVEFEQIKNRVSEIERRISLEIGNVQSEIQTENQLLDPVKGVQTAYEQTLVYAESLSPTTDQLARRLSRELKIRRSSEHVMRSPSARKIGTLKRRSRELERQNGKLARNQSWHVGTNTITIPRVDLRRNQSKSNSLISPNQFGEKNISTPDLSDRILRSALNKTNSQSSLNTTEKTSFHSAMSIDFVGDSSNHWTSADTFFSAIKTPNSRENTSNNRPSVAELRNQNAGMVLAKAKLFDNLIDSDSSGSSNKPSKTKTTYKIGGFRQSDKRLSKKGASPRRNRLNLSHKQKLYVAKQLVDGHKNKKQTEHSSENNPFAFDQDLISPIKYTPCRSPIIKKALMTRSPKRLCKTPHVDRSTPLKVFAPKSMEI